MTLNPKGEKILILNECDVIGKYMDEIVPDIDISKKLKNRRNYFRKNYKRWRSTNNNRYYPYYS